MMQIAGFGERNGNPPYAERNWSEGDNLRTEHFALGDLDLVPERDEAQPILNRLRGPASRR
jgi:hypothetical protein